MSSLSAPRSSDLAFVPGLARCVSPVGSSAFLQKHSFSRPQLLTRPTARRAHILAMSDRNPKPDSLDSIQLMNPSENCIIAEPPAKKAPDQSQLPERIVFSDEKVKAAMGDDETGGTDMARTGAVAVLVSLAAALLQHNWVVDHRDLTMEIIFVLGYLGITLEEIISYDKTGVALLMGVGVWTVLDTTVGPNIAGDPAVNALLSEQLADISQILFFLIGAMTIVEIVDAHRGFKVVTDFITTKNRRLLMWTIGVLTFFVSAVLDNLTSTIVVVSLLKKLVEDPKERWLYGAIAVVAANAGGAWTPIGGKLACDRRTFSPVECLYWGSF